MNYIADRLVAFARTGRDVKLVMFSNDALWTAQLVCAQSGQVLYTKAVALSVRAATPQIAMKSLNARCAME